MKKNRFWYWATAGLIAILLIGGIIWALESRNETGPTAGTGTSQKSDSTKPKTGSSPDVTATPQPQTYPVSIYFSKHPDSDNDPAKTFPVPRISPDLGLAKYSMNELLKGPSVSEQTQGYFTAIGFREGAATCPGDFKLAIADGTARLQFCRPFDHRGIVADGQADSELKATLLQFDTVKKVIILNSQGDCEFDLSGENRCLQ